MAARERRGRRASFSAGTVCDVGAYHLHSASSLLRNGKPVGPRFRPELDRFFADNLFNVTNQPDLHAPYLLAWAGDPAAADRIVRRYMRDAVPHRYTNAGVRPQPWVGKSFALSPQGFADGMGDDAGTMSAWYI